MILKLNEKKYHVLLNFEQLSDYIRMSGENILYASCPCKGKYEGFTDYAFFSVDGSVAIISNEEVLYSPEQAKKKRVDLEHIRKERKWTVHDGRLLDKLSIEKTGIFNGVEVLISDTRLSEGIQEYQRQSDAKLQEGFRKDAEWLASLPESERRMVQMYRSMKY